MAVLITGTAEVLKSLAAFQVREYALLSSTCKNKIGPMLEKRAKANAPWTDRTGAARRGLFAETVVSATEVVVALSHSVTYGVYLELGHAGRFAILQPTLNSSKAEIVAILLAELKV